VSAQLAVPVEDPVGRLIDAGGAGGAGGDGALQLASSAQDARNDVTSMRRQLRACLPLERPPLALLGMALGRRRGQPQDVEPVLPSGERLRACGAGLRRALLAHQGDLRRSPAAR
jgi:hypothetical protein